MHTRLSKSLFKLAMKIRGTEATWQAVENKLKVGRATMQSWNGSTKVVVTEALIQGLNSLGYDIRLVKITDEDKPTPDSTYSVEEVVKLAAAEGISYGEYVRRYLRK